MLDALGVDLAQALTHLVSFLITLWLLKKYAWGPLLNLLDERRNKIVGEFEQIERDKEDVAKLTEDYQLKLREIDDERRAKLVEAVEEGKKVAAEIKADAQAEARSLAEKSKADLQREIASAKVQLRDEMISLTMGAAEKVIREKMDDAKHRELIGGYIDDLEKVN